MSENENKPDPAVDDGANLKAEFGRKMGNYDEKLTAMEATNRELLAQITALANSAKPAPAPEPTGTKLSDMIYDEDAFDKTVNDRIEQRVNAQVGAVTQKQERQNAVIQSLAAEYPEISNPGHEVTKRAIEIYGGMSEEDRGSSLAYRTAVREAASEFGLKPVSKRSDNDSFSLKGGSSGAPERGSESDDLDPATEAFAKLMGINMDKKTKERMQNHSQRNWLTYKGDA